MRLPPGQRAEADFPRFGTHLDTPPPHVPANPGIEITGAVTRADFVALDDLLQLPRRELRADLHCVAGWSATGLRWEGVAFETFYRTKIGPAIRSDTTITHIGLRGLDGYHWTSRIEDALDASVLLADRLDGRPLNGDHGAPLRLVSPKQYGYVNVKHLCRIELFSEAPGRSYGAPSRVVDASLRSPLINPHPRARVWKEERHRYVPGRLLRPLYRLVIPSIRSLSARGSRGDEPGPGRVDDRHESRRGHRASGSPPPGAE